MHCIIRVLMPEDADITKVKRVSNTLIKVYCVIVGVALLSFASQFVLTALVFGGESIVASLLCTGIAVVLIVVGIPILYIMLEKEQRFATWLDKLFAAKGEQKVYSDLHLPEMPFLLMLFFVTLLISGVMVFVGCFFTIIALPIIFICITSPSLMWVSYVYSKDVYEPEPARMVLIALSWGMLSTIPALFGNTIVGAFTGGNAFVAAAIGAPLIEEFVKAWGIYFTRKDIDDEMDGLIYGVSAGIGFSMIENMFYVLGPLIASVTMPLQPSGYVFLTLIRGLACVMLHAIGPAAIGIGYGYYARNGFNAPAFLRIPLGYCVGVVYHAIWNGTSVLIDGMSGDALLQILLTIGHIVGLGLFVLATLYFLIGHAKAKNAEHWLARKEMLAKTGTPTEKVQDAKTQQERAQMAPSVQAPAPPTAIPQYQAPYPHPQSQVYYPPYQYSYYPPGYYQYPPPPPPPYQTLPAGPAQKQTTTAEQKKDDNKT